MSTPGSNDKTVKWIDLSEYDARLGVLNDNGQRRLVLTGLRMGSKQWLDIQRLGFQPATYGPWLIRDECNLNLRELRSVFPAAKTQVISVGAVLVSRGELVAETAALNEREEGIRAALEAFVAIIPPSCTTQKELFRLIGSDKKFEDQWLTLQDDLAGDRSDPVKKLDPSVGFVIENAQLYFRIFEPTYVRDAIASKYLTDWRTPDWDEVDAGLWVEACQPGLQWHTGESALLLAYSDLVCGKPDGASMLMKAMSDFPDYADQCASALAQEYLRGEHLPYDPEKAVEMFLLSMSASANSDAVDEVFVDLPIPEYKWRNEDEIFWEDNEFLAKMAAFVDLKDLERFLDALPLGVDLGTHANWREAGPAIKARIVADRLLSAAAQDQATGSQALMKACDILDNRLHALFIQGGAAVEEAHKIHDLLKELESSRQLDTAEAQADSEILLGAEDGDEGYDAVVKVGGVLAARMREVFNERDSSLDAAQKISALLGKLEAERLDDGWYGWVEDLPAQFDTAGISSKSIPFRPRMG